MGTNYYTDAKPPCPTCGHESEPLHVGKSSAGWTFCFQDLPELGLTSWRAWKAYLRNRVILDEYGKQIDFSDFESMVEARQDLRKDRGAHTTYDEQGYVFCNVDFS